MPRTAVDRAMTIQGMSSFESLALMDIFAARTVEHFANYRLVEFGAYKGRTAALLASHLGDRGQLDIVEQADYLQLAEVKSIAGAVTWHKEASERYCERNLRSETALPPVAVSHHDASHFFDNVRTELTYIAQCASPASVLILDDFNDSYSQVRAAFYQLRYAHAFPYEILLIAFNKCFLVHGEHFDEAEAFVLGELAQVLETEYAIPVKLSRTDIHERSRGFSLSRLRPDDGEQRYGRSFFGDRFYVPSSSVLRKREGSTR
jgi:hypothetical protein